MNIVLLISYSEGVLPSRTTPSDAFKVGNKNVTNAVNFYLLLYLKCALNFASKEMTTVYSLKINVKILQIFRFVYLIYSRKSR